MSMNMTEFTFSELNDVIFKAIAPVKIGERQFLPGEPIAIFDSIAVALIEAPVKLIKSTGGQNNNTLIIWEGLQEVQIAFTQGVFNKTHFALMMGAEVYAIEEEQALNYEYTQIHTDENGVFRLKEEPAGEIFAYDDKGERLEITPVGEKNVKVSASDSVISVYYQYNTTSGREWVELGGRLKNLGYFSLEGKTRIKHDVTGEEEKGIIRFPKVQLVSRLSMQLGKKAQPVVGAFQIIALPSGVNRKNTIMEFSFLAEDIE